MSSKKLLFLTLNTTWGGSEILWSQSAKRFIKKGWQIKAGAFYDFVYLKHSLISETNYLDLRDRFPVPPFFERQLKKLLTNTPSQKDLLADELRNNTPDLVIISQGNNKDGQSLMECCVEENIPFINIVHLVSESLWPGLDDNKIEILNALFDKAVTNYFVSKHTWNMHEKILGCQLLNGKIIYNPFSKNTPEDSTYPTIKNGVYKIALVGRLEIFHKGYDLLLDVVKEKKWQQRSISFSIFGQGPHKELLKRTIQQHGIANIHVYSYTDNVEAIWQVNHLLLMPSRMEGQSLTLIEAMRFKRAVIATNVGGVAELVENGVSGFIAKYPTAEHIALALEEAWEARDRWEQMGMNAYEGICKKHPQDAVGFFNDEIEIAASLHSKKANSADDEKPAGNFPDRNS